MLANGESGSVAVNPAGNARTDWLVRLFEKSGECVCYGPRDLSRFDYVSPGCQKLFGVNLSELREHPRRLADLVHPEDKEATERDLLGASHRECVEEYRIVRPDGTGAWVRTKLVELDSETIALVSNDISDRFLATVDVLESMQEGYIALDKDWRISYANRVALEAMRLPRRKVIGRLLWDMAPHLSETDLGSSLLEAAKDGKDRRFETQGAFSGRWYDVTLHPHDSGICVFGKDITIRKTALEEVRCQETRFRMLYEHAPVGLLLLDFDRIVRDVNPKLCGWLGRTSGEMLGRDVLEFIAEPYRKPYLEMRVGLLATGYAHSEFPFLHADGHQVELDWSLTKDALPGLNMGAAVEIGERKASERAQALQVELSEAARDVLDPGELMHKTCELLRQSLEAKASACGLIDESEGTLSLPCQLASNDSTDQSPIRISELGAGLLDSLSAGNTVQIDDVNTDPLVADCAEAHRRAGFHAHILVPLVRHGRLAAVFGVQQGEPRKWREEEVRLVQHAAQSAWLAYERSNAEFALRRANLELEVRVEARTAELQSAVRELEGFTFSVSHDLRGPLRSIMASAMMLREDFGDQIGSEGQDQLNRVGAAAKKMATLIDELLKISRLNRQEMRLEPLDLSALAHEAADDVGRPADYKIQPNLCANADARLMRLVLINLFDNATKYVLKDQTPVVEFGQDERGFFVRDNGIGFEQDYAEKIFKPFERLVRDAEYPGTGVGLANVQRILQRHGGKVWAESSLGHGATFYFSL